MYQQNEKVPHTPLPWTWHAKSIDQAHNGSIYRMERPGHAYAIAMQPRYVDDKQFNANAAFITRACNSHYALVEALEAAKAAMLRTRTASIAGCEEGYGKPEKWADELFASHGDLTKAIKLSDAALSAAKGET